MRAGARAAGVALRAHADDEQAICPQVDGGTQRPQLPLRAVAIIFSVDHHRWEQKGYAHAGHQVIQGERMAPADTLLALPLDHGAVAIEKRHRCGAVVAGRAQCERAQRASRMLR